MNEETMTPEEKGIHIDYHKPAFYKRIFACLLDLLFFVAMSVLLFTLTRYIVSKTPAYQEVDGRITEVKKDCGIYRNVNGEYQDVVTFYSDINATPGTIMDNYEESINTYLTFVKEKAGEETYIKQAEKYDTYRLNLTYLGEHLFVRDEKEEIIFNPSLKMENKYDYYNKNCYEPYISNEIINDLLIVIPGYYKDTRTVSMTLTFIDLPVGVLLGAILIYYVPPLIFKRGRQTFGMLIYHISRTNSSLLHLSYGRYTAYEAIFIFGILLLSFLTFGIPIIISLCMMCFSKNKQDFGEYLLGIYHVDTTTEIIYYSLFEISQHYAENRNVSSTFKAKDRL